MFNCLSPKPTIQTMHKHDRISSVWYSWCMSLLFEIWKTLGPLGLSFPITHLYRYGECASLLFYCTVSVCSLFSDSTVVICCLYSGCIVVVWWLCSGWMLVLQWLNAGCTVVVCWMSLDPNSGWMLVLQSLNAGFTVGECWLYSGCSVVILATTDDYMQLLCLLKVVMD